MFKPLQGKVITVMGSSGYVGQNIIRQAHEYGAVVHGVSRRGYPQGYQQVWHKEINWIRGDAMDTTGYQDILKQSDMVIHTIGTLIDTSITKRSTPGDIGTYEHMNRDTLINVANTLKNTKTLLVYLSASNAPPFIPRYIQTKEEAEQHLLDLHKQNQLDSVILKPGLIYSWQHRWWSVPVMIELEIWKCLYGGLNKVIPQNSFIGNVFKEFNVESGVRLQDVIDCSLSCLNRNNVGLMLNNKQIEQTANTFRNSK